MLISLCRIAQQEGKSSLALGAAAPTPRKRFCACPWPGASGGWVAASRGLQGPRLHPCLHPCSRLAVAFARLAAHALAGGQACARAWLVAGGARPEKASAHGPRQWQPAAAASGLQFHASSRSWRLAAAAGALRGRAICTCPCSVAAGCRVARIGHGHIWSRRAEGLRSQWGPRLPHSGWPGIAKSPAPTHPLTAGVAVAAVARWACSSVPTMIRGGCASVFLVGLVAPTQSRRQWLCQALGAWLDCAAADHY